MTFLLVGMVVVFIFTYVLNKWVKTPPSPPKKKVQPIRYKVESYKVDENIVVEKKEKQVQYQPSSPTVEVKEEVLGEQKKKVSARTLVIAFAVMLLFILYLFALNNRYHIDNRYIYDKWLNRYTYQGYHEWIDWVG